MIYFSHVHSIITHRIIFWAIHPTVKLYLNLKKTIRIITNFYTRDPCRDRFKDLKILAFDSQYIFSLLLFVVKKKEVFKANSDIHSVYTRHRTNLQPPLLHLFTSQKSVYFSGIKIIDHLPQNTKDLSHDIKKFEDILKTFLPMGSFYSLEEYFVRESWYHFQ
jgi:hypothetical protein